MRRDPITRAGLTEEHLDDLVKKSLDGDRTAWTELWLALLPLVQTIAGRARVTGRLAASADEQSSVALRFMGELRKDGSRLLRELSSRLAQRDGSYRRWLAQIAIHTAISHVRAHPEYLGSVAPEAGGRWAKHVPLDETLEEEAPDPVRAIEAHRILACSREELDPAQHDALCRWLRREDFDEIAVGLHLDGGSEAARHLVRSALKRLRVRFAPPDPRPPSGGPPSRGRGHDRAAASRGIDRTGAPVDRRRSGARTTRRVRQKKIDRCG